MFMFKVFLFAQINNTNKLWRSYNSNNHPKTKGLYHWKDNLDSIQFSRRQVTNGCLNQQVCVLLAGE